MNVMLALVDCTSFYVSCEKAFNVALRGKPVLVLTNNDACIAALSKEAKELGLKRGTPLFQCRDLIEEHQVVLLSSNYSLYHDMSARVMATLAAFSPQPLEVFSIDEAFLGVSRK
jgi:DNA polymerase V